jgi:hypothetical protein
MLSGLPIIYLSVSLFYEEEISRNTMPNLKIINIDNNYMYTVYILTEKTLNA